METDRRLELHPIGRVVAGPARPDECQDSPSEVRDRPAVVEIDPAWSSALEGIEEFSHIWVVWWFDLSPAGRDLDSLQVRPEGRKEMPLRGVFATRSPRRPNPIAMTPVRLLAREGTRLQVEGLEAFEGTPILDLKPYLRRGDLIPEANTPAWLERLWRIHDEERD